MSAEDTAVRLAKDVVLQVIDGDALLLKLDDEVVFSLNATGARIVKLIADGHRVPEIVQVLSEEYGASPADVEEDVVGLVRTLAARGLVVARDEREH